MITGVSWYQVPQYLVSNRFRIDVAERTTRQYLHELSPTSCLEDLSKALDQLLVGVDRADKIFTKFATTDPNGKRFWDSSNFARYITASIPNNQAVIESVPLLWRIFLCSAYFPFSPPRIVGDKASGSGESKIDYEAFRRAFALLVLRGIELYGTLQNGHQYSFRKHGKHETSYNDKVPRLARLIFKCLSVPSPDQKTTFKTASDELHYQDVLETTLFAQPITYDSDPYGKKIQDEEFEAAASRLLDMEDEKSSVLGPLSSIRKAELQSLIQLLLLLHQGRSRWRDGLSLDLKFFELPRTGHVQCAHLVSDPDEVSQAADNALTFVTWKLGSSDDSVFWDEFQAWCLECVSLSPE